MTETVVHVTTIEEWKSVLDVWFKQGHTWRSYNAGYEEHIFENGGRFLFLDDYVTWNMSNYNSEPFIEYSDFMAQQKEDNKMATVYEVSQYVFDELQRIRAHEDTSLIGSITWNAQFIESIKVGNKAIIRYLADDPAIEFKVKDPLYRLSRIDAQGDKVYMKFSYGTPDWTMDPERALTAPLEEIEKHKNSYWEIEEAK